MGAALRIFCDDETTPAAGNRRETLSEVYREDIAPAADVSPSTARGIRQTLALWSRLTADPALDELRQADVNRFRAALAAAGPATTANKHLRHLRALLNAAGPATARNPDALELLPKALYVKMLPELPPNPVHLSDAELGALHAAAKIATWPRTGIPARYWWEAFIVVAVTYGPRIGDLIGLTWPNIETDDAGDWITWRAQKTGKPHRWPVNPATAEALERLDRYRDRFTYDPEDRIFRAPSNPAKLYSTFRAIAAAAGITRPEALSFHALRATAARRYDQHARGLGAVILGHAAPRNVTDKHYLGAAALAEAYAAILTLTPPPGFKRN